MRFFLLMLLLAFISGACYSSNKNDSLLVVLKTELSKKKLYDDQKEANISKLKYLSSHTSKTNYKAQYTFCSKLYEEYKVYQFDSAYVYTQKLLGISKALNNLPMQYESQIRLGFILMSSGMFKETFDCLNRINTALLSDSSKLEYYSIKARASSDLADYNNDKYYGPEDNAESIRYLDSAIAVSKPNTFDQLSRLGEKQLREGKIGQASKYYIELLSHNNLTAHQRAMAATGLSFFYTDPSQSEARMNLLTIGAINDLRSSTKETLAIFKLGEELYKRGNVKDAYTFIQQAMEDAEYYGARLRKIKIGAVLPVVDKQRIIVMEQEKNKFLIYFVLIAIVAVMIAFISFVEFNQLKRLKAKEKIIEDKNAQLEHINGKLTEDTRIKEEYIGYFFNSISGYILKLEKIKRSVERKLATKKYEDILLTVNEINIKKERDALFYTFDHIFLKIFPNFITSFNSLLKKEDQIWPKDNEVLNTDLRIFALMRLGINDNEAIANILEYSVNTIYVYKMRIKAKALVPNDQFDHKIMDIKAVDVLSKT
jgi:tetratricopeptide (TPR) repeat protein